MKKRIERLKRKGVVLTIQRIGVLEILHNSPNHPTAEEIHKKLLEKYPTLSLATVYNTLQILKQAGEIQELNIGKEKRFDPIPGPHHHFYCRVCERIIDVEIACPVLDKGYVDNHKIENVQAVFFGICADCQKKEEKNA